LLEGVPECDIPEWYASVPQDPNYLFSAKSATSQDMQISLEKATADARGEIGSQVAARVQGLQKRFDEEVGTGQDTQLLQQFTQAGKAVVATSLTDTRVKAQKMCKDGEMWRSYVLVEYPFGAASETLMKQLKQNEQMFTRFRSSQTFKDLDNEVQKYDDWKKQRQPLMPGSANR